MTLDHETRALLRVAVSDTRRAQAATAQAQAQERERLRKSSAASAEPGEARAVLRQPIPAPVERQAVPARDVRRAVPARVDRPPIPDGPLGHLAVERGRHLVADAGGTPRTGVGRRPALSP